MRGRTGKGLCACAGFVALCYAEEEDYGPKPCELFHFILIKDLRTLAVILAGDQQGGLVG